MDSNQTRTDTVYERLGVRPIINAAGTFTDLGGSLMPPPVAQAWIAAAKTFVNFRELQDRAGEYLAQLLGVPAVLVTGGAASSILLATSAALTLKDARFISTGVVADDGLPYEVLRQRAHRDIYDRQVAMCGVRIVEVESEFEFSRSVSPRTIMALAYNVYDAESNLRHEAWLELCKRFSIPTLLDAAADVPPVSNLSEFSRMGYDLVAFSGGKAIRGPQSSGLLIGRPDLIEAAKLNAVPNEGTIGRVAKVSKEDIVALCKAVELFVSDDPDYSGKHLVARCQTRLAQVAEHLQRIDGVQLEFVTPLGANAFPHLRLVWPEQQWNLGKEVVEQRLLEGTPPITIGRVYGVGDAGIVISAINLDAAEAEQVGQRLKELFSDAAGVR